MSNIMERLNGIPDRLAEHGDELRATLQTVCDLLGAQLQEIEAQRTERTRGYLVEGGVVPGGAVDLNLDFRPPPGIAWSVTLVSSVCGAGGGLALYLNDDTPENLVYVQPGAAFNAPGSPTDIYVPAGQLLIARFYSQPAAAECYCRLGIDIIGNEREDLP